MNLNNYFKKKSHLFKISFAQVLKNKKETISMDKILIGSQAGYPLETWVEMSKEFSRLSTPISQSPYVQFLQEVSQNEDILNNDEKIATSSYYKMGMSCIQTAGTYMGATNSSELITWMKSYYQSYKSFINHTEQEPFPFKQGHSGKNDLICVAKIKNTDFYEVLDGHHRIAFHYITASKEIEALVAYTKYSGLQHFLLKINQIHDVELYQPINKIEVLNWPVVRKCTDRFDKMLSILKQEHIDSGSMIDLACSYGFFPKSFKKNGFTVKGLDRDPDAIVVAKEITGLEADEVICERIEDYFKKTNDKFDVVLFLSILHHYAIGKEPGNVIAMLQQLDKITNKVLFLDTGQGHEAWFKKSLKDWDEKYIEDLILKNTSFKKVVNLGTDNDNVGKYVDNYKRALFACIK